MYINNHIGQQGLKKIAEEIASRLSFNCNVHALAYSEWQAEVKSANLNTPINLMIQFENMDMELFMYAAEVNDREVLRIYSWGVPDGLERYSHPRKRKLISHGEVPIGPNGEGIEDAMRHALRVLFDMSVSVDPVNQRLQKLAKEWPLEKRAN